MKIYNIIVRNSPDDTYDLPISQKNLKLILPAHRNSSLFSSNIFELLESSNLEPNNAVFDLLNISLAIYTIDQIVSRSEHGYLGWSRHIKVHVPVSNLIVWNKSKHYLEDLLSFLSGDKWEIQCRSSKLNRVRKGKLISNPDGITNVSLFSGGLDSFIGAIDLLETKNKVAFVSHYKAGSESPTQDKLYKLLSTNYGPNAFQNFRFRVQPNQKAENVSKEYSSRARSFLFFCLGITIANTLGDDVELIVPENGLISLNIPLTGSRISSHSTRTTHPYYMSLFRSLISSIGIKNPMSNPYQFKTKGEMMKECKNKKFLKAYYTGTLSCSHPDISRFIKGNKASEHCGYCVPCIIRQAAENHSGLNKSDYLIDIKKAPPEGRLQKGRDLKAFRMALEKFKLLKPHSFGLEILRSGPLPFANKKELDNYIDLYKRGMGEVAKFLKK